LNEPSLQCNDRSAVEAPEPHPRSKSRNISRSDESGKCFSAKRTSGNLHQNKGKKMLPNPCRNQERAHLEPFRESFVFDPGVHRVTRAIRLKDDPLKRGVFLDLKAPWMQSDPVDPPVLLRYGAWSSSHFLTKTFFEGKLSELTRHIDVMLDQVICELTMVSAEAINREGKSFADLAQGPTREIRSFSGPPLSDAELQQFAEKMRAHTRKRQQMKRALKQVMTSIFRKHDFTGTNPFFGRLKPQRYDLFMFDFCRGMTVLVNVRRMTSDIFGGTSLPIFLRCVRWKN
jgi:hypothetical protein